MRGAPCSEGGGRHTREPAAPGVCTPLVWFSLGWSLPTDPHPHRPPPPPSLTPYAIWLMSWLSLCQLSWKS